jgi:hypothetical protein
LDRAYSHSGERSRCWRTGHTVTAERGVGVRGQANSHSRERTGHTVTAERGTGIR